jgi:hypothetical protein
MFSLLLLCGLEVDQDSPISFDGEIQVGSENLSTRSNDTKPTLSGKTEVGEADHISPKQ